MVQQPPPNCHDTKTRFLQLPTTILLSACSTQVSTVNDYHCGMKVVHLFILFLLPTPTSKALVYQLFRAFYDIIIALPTSILGGNPVLSHTKIWGGTGFVTLPKVGLIQIVFAPPSFHQRCSDHCSHSSQTRGVLWLVPRHAR